MEPRGRVVTRQQKRMLDFRRALSNKPPEHVNHRPGSGHLIDFSGFEGPSVRQSNALRRGSETHMTSASMKEFLAVQKAQLDAFLQQFGEQAEAQRSALGHIMDQFAGIAASLGSTVAHWLGHPAAHQQAHLYKELELAHMRAIDAEGRCQQLEKDHQTLQKQLVEDAKERDELRKVADLANWTGAAKISDDVIRSQWKQLDYNIRVMARALAKCQTKRPTDDSNKKRFESIVTSWPELLENDDYKEFLLAAYLWILVNKEIFSNGDEFWGGGFARGLKHLRQNLVELAPEADGPLRSEPTMRHVAKWSAQGIALISHFYGRNKKAPKKQATNALGRLKLFCNIAADTSGTDFLREIKGIMKTALELDEMLMGSLAIWSIQWLRSGQSKSLRYDADKMDAVAYANELSPKTAVVLAISPMLLKTGNANGCNYDSEMVLCKASVVCD